MLVKGGPELQIDGLIPKRCNSSAIALELHLFCITPGKCNTWTHNSPHCLLWGLGMDTLVKMTIKYIVKCHDIAVQYYMIYHAALTETKYESEFKRTKDTL